MKKALAALLGFSLFLLASISFNDKPVLAQTAPIPVAPQAYPLGATSIVAVGTGTTGAVTATLAASATLRTFMCGITVSAIGGTATVGPVSISNVNGATFTIQLASTVAGNFYSQSFEPCLPTSAINTAMVATTTADGTASAVDVNMWGYQAP